MARAAFLNPTWSEVHVCLVYEHARDMVIYKRTRVARAKLARAAILNPAWSEVGPSSDFEAISEARSSEEGQPKFSVASASRGSVHGRNNRDARPDYPSMHPTIGQATSQ